jgi:PKD repeat protein
MATAQNTQKSTKAIQSLSDYDFIGTGYGVLTEPSSPLNTDGTYNGKQVPYVPDLSNLDASKVVVVSNASELQSNLGSNKIIVCKDGTYDFKISKDNLSNTIIISKNKWGAKITGGGPKFAFAGNGVHDICIIGFEAIGTGEANADKNIFIKSSSRDAWKTVYKVYISDMKFHEYALALYGGLHSHDWTVDKTLHYNSNLSYLWYMMGWHHSVINSIMYNNTRYSIALRGCYPLDETYYYSDHDKNPRISERKEHFLASNDWTHLIVNNTFGSVYDDSRPSSAFVTLYYNAEEGERNKEDVYFPPKNIVLANNAFIDNGDQNKYPFKIFANRGINTGAVDAVNGVTVKNNYTDKSIILVSDYSNHNIDLSTNKTNVSESSMGFDDSNRNYKITTSSVLYNSGATDVYAPNIDFGGENYRVGTTDVGAYEAPGQTAGVTSDFIYSVSACNPNVTFTNNSSQASSYLWNFGDNQTSTSVSPSHVYSNPGTYTVELTAYGEGGTSDIETKQVTVDFAAKPTSVSAIKNNDGTVSLSASATGTINWYDVATGGEPIATGDNVTVTSAVSTFYAENVTGGGTTYTGAKKDKGTGGYYPYDDSEAIFGLKFDATTDVTIKSVKVYNNGSDYTGARTFTLKDASGKTLVEKTVNVADGEQRLILDISVPKGNGYMLLADNKKGLWRDNEGVSYPYTVGDAVNITSGVRYDGNTYAIYYYFFYDWEIQTGSAGCASERTKVDVITSVEDNLLSTIAIYPNPTAGNFYVTNLPNENCQILIFDNSNKLIKKEFSNGENNKNITLNNIIPGVYFCKIVSDNNIEIKKIIINKH